MMVYTKNNKQKEYKICKEGVGLIRQSLNQEIEKVKDSVSSKSFPDNHNAKSLFSNSHSSALFYLTKASSDSKKALIQAIMINEIHNSISSYAKQSGIHNLTPYESAKMDIQQRAAYKLIGAKAGSWLSTTKVLFECMLYALFPLIILYSTAPFGGIGVLKNYIIAFAWLILWGPSYAVINMIATYANKVQTGNVFDQGLTMINQLEVISVQDNISAMAGYFSMLVPILSLVVFKGVGIMSSLAHNLGTVMQSTAGSVASETASGNIAVGNTSFNNVSANKYDASNFYKGSGHKTDILSSGIARYTSADGIMTYDTTATQDKITTSFGLNNQDTEALSDSISRNKTLSQDLRESAINSSGLAANRAMSKAESQDFKVSSSDSYSAAQRASINRSMQHVNSELENISKDTGLTRNQVLDMAAAASLGIDKSAIKASIGANYKAGVTSEDAFKQIEQFSKSKDYKTAMGYMIENANTETFEMRDSHGNTITTTVGEQWQSSQNRAIGASRLESIAKAESIQLANMKQRTITQNTNLNGKYTEFLGKRYNTTEIDGILNHKNHNS